MSNVPPEQLQRRGLLFVLSSPSGAGKTTISKKLLQEPDIEMSVSVTTRAARKQETDGIDYTFVNEPTFAGMVERGDLLEHATVFGYHYGTPRQPVEQLLSAGKDVLFDIDWQGTQQLKQTARDQVVSVFLLPPSIQELERRLRSRAQDSEEIVQRRMQGAQDEIRHWAEYDYVLVNDDLDRTMGDVLSILRAERLRRERRVGLYDYVRTLRTS